jgi:hypothetical protein
VKHFRSDKRLLWPRFFEERVKDFYGSEAAWQKPFVEQDVQVEGMFTDRQPQ